VPGEQQRLGVVGHLGRGVDVVLEHPEHVPARLHARPRPVPVLVLICLS